MAGQKKRHHMTPWASRRGNVIEISGIVSTTDRCIKAVVKKTGKVANFPRRITDFAPGMAIVPLWLYRKISRSTDEASDQRS